MYNEIKNKAAEVEAIVVPFLDTVPNEQKRQVVKTLLDLLEKALIK